MISPSFTYCDLGRISYEKALTIQTNTFNRLNAEKIQGASGENVLFFL